MASRRFFLLASGAVICAPVARAQTARYPFTLGVASGSPRPDGAVIWTRLAPEPLNGGGMPATGSAAVRWRVCTDETMRATAREGVFETTAARAHSVHVTLRGLEPGREYWYQFLHGDDVSTVGRLRTAEPRGAAVRLAFASCNSFEWGRFAAYGDMARWAPDCVIHVGDYIYEGARTALGTTTRNVGGSTLTFEVVRQHDGPETVTLWDYRNRYALYRSDPQLQAAHAASPWIVSMDDHEIDNNWAGDVPQDPWAQTRLEFQVRKRAALQAYYEHMPLEAPPTFDGVDAHLQMFGDYRLGPANVFLLDTRQYRSDQVCGDGFPGEASCAALEDPALTLTGAAQERWLTSGLAHSGAKYNVVASQTWFAPFRYNAAPEAPRINTDQWDGYPLQRQRIIDALGAASAKPVALSGDWHCAAAMRIHANPWDVRSRRVGHNFCGTSISSVCPWADTLAQAKDFNPHVDYIDGRQRGYLRVTANARDLKADFRVVQDPRLAESSVSSALEIGLADA